MCEITKATLGRLPTYLEFLYNVKDERETISTSTIANALSFGAVQVKKDLSSVCDKGKPKVGYKTAELIQDIEKERAPRPTAKVLALFLKLVQDIVVSDVQQQYDGVPIILPYNSDVHIDAEFEQVCRSLYPLCPK